MEDWEKRLNEVRDFEKDLKAVFEKHKIHLENDSVPFHGGCTDLINIIVDGNHYIMWDFEETLRNIEVID